MKRAVAPQGEARTDRQIFAALAERLGCLQDYTDCQDDGQALRAMHERAGDSAAAHGHVLPDFATFWERGHHRYDLPAAPPPFAAFRADPDRAPLATPSGRIELFSETVHGYGYDECPGHPVWIPRPSGWAPRLRGASRFTCCRPSRHPGCTASSTWPESVRSPRSRAGNRSR